VEQPKAIPPNEATGIAWDRDIVPPERGFSGSDSASCRPLDRMTPSALPTSRTDERRCHHPAEQPQGVFRRTRAFCTPATRTLFRDRYSSFNGRAKAKNGGPEGPPLAVKFLRWCLARISHHQPLLASHSIFIS
jgi:hypothetical protein